MSSVLCRRGLALFIVAQLVTSGCATGHGSKAVSAASASQSSRPVHQLDYPFVYIGSGTHPGAIEHVHALDAKRIKPMVARTMSCVLWFQHDLSDEVRTSVEAGIPAALGAEPIWGQRFVYLAAVENLEARLGPEGLATLATELDTWVTSAHAAAPLVFALREGSKTSRAPGSWHRQSMYVTQERIVPTLTRWFSAHSPAIDGERGTAVARIVCALVRYIDAHEERWIRAYEDPRWTQLIEQSLGYDFAVDMENASAAIDARLPGPLMRALAWRVATQTTLAIRGRPSTSGNASARMLAEATRAGVFSKGWLAQAFDLTARSYATRGGFEAAAGIGEACLGLSSCPASTYSATVGWWIDSGRLAKARAAISRGLERWPGRSQWAKLEVRIEQAESSLEADRAAAQGGGS